ncbi:MAG: GNAT family N-acetyltransferase [Lachnospiraceae bacterium]|nr:GNAT family N-acetyltransferase [Lachnospiraceae bacterium]
MERYCIEKNALTPEIYESLRAKVSLQHYGEEDVKEALAHTLFSVVVKEGQVPVGIGRIVGDGRIVFFIKDVVVEPSRQNCGIGRMIMEELMLYIKQHGCRNAYAGLMALTGKEGFYEKFGFRVRPYDGQGSGMTQLVNVDLPL